jgi:hypothetical protein
MVRSFWAAGAALVALTLVGCGSEDSSSGTAETENAVAETAASGADPCSLVTSEEIAAVIGEPIVGKAANDGRCEYQTADAAASSVTIELDQADALGAMDVARKAAGVLKDVGGAVADQGGAGADVNAALSDSGDSPKIGEEAFFGPNQQLSVRKGSSYIAVSPPMMRSRMAAGNPMLSAADKKKMAMAIAEKAVSRLP